MNGGRGFEVALVLAISSLLLSSTFTKAQEPGQVSYKVGHKPLVSITNSCGGITAKPSLKDEVSATYVVHDTTVTFDHQKHGRRISLGCTSAHSGNNLAEYTVIVPPRASVTMFATGPVHVEGLTGDIEIETLHSAVDIRDLEGAYIHVKTFDGPVLVEQAHNAHIFLHSVDGELRISDTPSSWVEADSASGRIEYGGDPGMDGEFRFTSQSGDLEISIPASASIDLQTNSAELRQFQQRSSPSAPTKSQGTSFTGSVIANRSHFNLRSLTGRIHLQRP